MIVRRAGRAHRFTIVDNDVIEDDELSFRALGLLTYLLSKPDDWTVDAEKLADTHAEGRDAVRAALEHLELAGYAVRRRYREGGRYATETVIYDRPCDREIGSITHHDGKPALVTRRGKSGAYTSTDTKDGKQEENGSGKPRRISNRADDDSQPADESPSLGSGRIRETRSARKDREESTGTTTFGLVLRLKRQLEKDGYSAPVNERALVRSINSWNLSHATVEKMLELFASNPRSYLKGNEVPWTGLIRQREVLKADAGKVVEAEDPTAKFRAG